MTPCTAKREPEQRLAERIDLLVNDVHLHLYLVRLGQHLWPQREESGGNKQLAPARIPLRILRL